MLVITHTYPKANGLNKNYWFIAYDLVREEKLFL